MGFANEILQCIDFSMSDANFERISKLVKEKSGIKLPPIKKSMVEARLRKRLTTLNFQNYEEYCHYLFENEYVENEIVALLDLISTNKTEFFREDHHFKFLSDVVLPERNRQRINIWSAGCSTGEEPYTIAITLEEYARKQRTSSFDYLIFATDICTDALKKAQRGIYNEQQTFTIPTEILHRYFLKNKIYDNKIVKAAPLIQKKIIFNRLNFMQPNYNIEYKFDAIFLRNVIIYFDQHTQQKLITRLTSFLKTGGYLFLGHSESLSQTDMSLSRIKSTIFRKKT